MNPSYIHKRLDAIERKLRNPRDTGVMDYTYPPHILRRMGMNPPELPDDATPAQRQLDAEIRAMDASVLGGRPTASEA